MSWYHYLWPWKKRIEEEKKADELFKAQIKEALLAQDDLREAAAKMKKASERSFRRELSSRPT